jgi:hypothetical protein
VFERKMTAGLAVMTIDELISIVKMFSNAKRLRKNGVSMESRLYHDLGIFGDDADDLFKLIHEKTGAYLFDLCNTEYFAAEEDALSLTRYLYHRFLARRTYKELTVKSVFREIERRTRASNP